MHGHIYISLIMSTNGSLWLYFLQPSLYISGFGILLKAIRSRRHTPFTWEMFAWTKAWNIFLWTDVDSYIIVLMLKFLEYHVAPSLRDTYFCFKVKPLSSLKCVVIKEVICWRLWDLKLVTLGDLTSAFQPTVYSEEELH